MSFSTTIHRDINIYFVVEIISDFFHISSLCVTENEISKTLRKNANIDDENASNYCDPQFSVTGYVDKLSDSAGN